jgi:hypothetical protein
MSYLKHKDTGQVIGPMADDSPEYLFLQAKRDGSGRPLWEDQGTQAAGVTGAADQRTIQTLNVAVAAGANGGEVVGKAPIAGVVTSVTYIPNATITGAATNNRRFDAVNLGQAGAGSTNIASLAMVGGVNIAANTQGVIPLNSTPANLNVNQGDEIQFTSTAVGTGIADPGGLVIVTIARET